MLKLVSIASLAFCMSSLALADSDSKNLFSCKKLGSQDFVRIQSDTIPAPGMPKHIFRVSYSISPSQGTIGNVKSGTFEVESNECHRGQDSDGLTYASCVKGNGFLIDSSFIIKHNENFEVEQSREYFVHIFHNSERLGFAQPFVNQYLYEQSQLECEYQ